MKQLNHWGGDFHTDSRLDTKQDEYIDHLEKPHYGYQGVQRIKHSEAQSLDYADDLTQE